MYERFFQLRERPFALSPDPDYLYRSRVHSEALSYLRYGIEGHAGFIVITGEIGSGKTTLLQTALRGVDQQAAVSRVVNTQLDARDLIEAVMLDFGLAPEPGMSKPRLLRVLAEYLVQQRIGGRLALLVIDEAQNLSQSALEEVRMLSNLETEKSKLIQIVLVGQPELRALMARPELEQLRQRVTVSYHLPALDVDETAAYINHRLARAAAGAPVMFPRDVSDRVHQHSHGVPRRINVIADAILLYAYGDGQRDIDATLADKAIDELKASGILTTDAPAAAVSTAATVEPAPVMAAPAPAASAATATAAPAPEAVTEVMARQERLLTTLQHMLTEQNHLLQLYREQLATLTAQASRPAPSAPAPSQAAADRRPAETPGPRAASPPREGEPSRLAATDLSLAPLAPDGMASQWAGATSTHRLLSAPAATSKSGLWTRLGRGLFGTFSPAYRD